MPGISIDFKFSLAKECYYEHENINPNQLGLYGMLKIIITYIVEKSVLLGLDSTHVGNINLVTTHNI